LSGREIENGLKGHFVSFDDPVNDLSTALKLLAAKLPRPHIGLAHSMGGGDRAARAADAPHRTRCGGVLRADVGHPGLSPMAKKYVRFMVSLGAGGQFAPSVERKWKRENFKKNPVTHDKERHARCQGLIAKSRAWRWRDRRSAGSPPRRTQPKRSSTRRAGARAHPGADRYRGRRAACR
jgi:lysophospholipase